MHTSLRLAFFSLLSMSGAIYAPAQTKVDRPETDNLYSMALIATINEMQKSWGHINDNEGGNGIRADYNHMLVMKTTGITNDLLEQFGDHHVQYVDYRGQVEKYKNLGKEFSILEIHPIQNDGPRLRITVSVSWVSYKKKSLVYGLSDWSDVEFQYDCPRKTFVISSVKLGGI